MKWPASRLALQKQIFGRDLKAAHQDLLDKAFEKEYHANLAMDVARDKYFPGTSARRLQEIASKATIKAGKI